MKWKIAFRSTNRHEIDLALNQANVAVSQGNFNLAREFANTILNSPLASRNSKLTAEFILVQVRSRQGQFSGVLTELDNLMKKVPRSNKRLQAQIGVDIVWVCFRSGNLGLGALRGEEFLRNYETVWPDTELVELLCQLGSCHFHHGDISRADELIHKALEIAEKEEVPRAMTHSYWQMSTLATEQGDLPLALRHAKKAQFWAAKAGFNQVVSILIGNSALLMLDLPNPEYSHISELVESAYLDLLSQNYPGHAAYVAATLSEIALRQEDFTRALYYAQKGLNELPPEITGPIAFLRVQIAKVLARMGKSEESKAELNAATTAMEELEPSRDLARQWGDIARVFVEVGLADRGVYAYEKAIQMSGLLREEQDSFVG